MSALRPHPGRSTDHREYPIEDIRDVCTSAPCAKSENQLAVRSRTSCFAPSVDGFFGIADLAIVLGRKLPAATSAIFFGKPLHHADNLDQAHAVIRRTCIVGRQPAISFCMS